MVEKLGMVHLSAGDLLRAERNREGSEFGYLGDERRLTYCHKPIYKRNRKKKLKIFPNRLSYTILIPVFGELIQQYIKDGLIVPIAITCKLIENAMNKRHLWVFTSYFELLDIFSNFFYSLQFFLILKKEWPPNWDIYLFNLKKSILTLWNWDPSLVLVT